MSTISFNPARMADKPQSSKNSIPKQRSLGRNVTDNESGKSPGCKDNTHMWTEEESDKERYE